jgi:hypothetical protein
VRIKVLLKIRSDFRVVLCARGKCHFRNFPNRDLVRGGDLSHRLRESRSEAACGTRNLDGVF